MSRGCLKSFDLHKWSSGFVAPAKAGVYLTSTHSMDSRLRGNDATYFRKQNYLYFTSLGTASLHLPPL